MHGFAQDHLGLTPKIRHRNMTKYYDNKIIIIRELLNCLSLYSASIIALQRMIFVMTY